MKFTDSNIIVPVANQLYLDGNNLSFTLSATAYAKKSTSGDASNPIFVPGSAPAISASEHYSFTVTDKNESDDKKNIAVAKMLGQNFVDTRFGKIFCSAKKLDADFFRQVLDTVSRDDKRFRSLTIRKFFLPSLVESLQPMRETPSLKSVIQILRL
jgi:hypothetical protein